MMCQQSKNLELLSLYLYCSIQVHELHRLWRVQRDLMLEYDRNPLQRNSSSSPVPTNQHSTNENNSVFYSIQNRPNLEFVREGSAQSSANVVPAKRPMFDLRLPASEYIDHENGFGLGNSSVSCFGKGGVVSSANGAGSSRNERNLVSDLNEPVEEITGLDFLGVNREPVWHRRADEGSSSGSFYANRKIANEELSLEKEKGMNSLTYYNCTGSFLFFFSYYCLSKIPFCSFFTLLVLSCTFDINLRLI